jgi:hypothetical protein
MMPPLLPVPQAAQVWHCYSEAVNIGSNLTPKKVSQWKQYRIVISLALLGQHPTPVDSPMRQEQCKPLLCG